MALIEDRTRYLLKLKDINVLRPYILPIKGEELEQLEPPDLIASILAKELQLQLSDAQLWVHYVLDPTKSHELVG
jgi:hypothetical protein